MTGSTESRVDAVNPGQWMLHCHNAYHGEAGMMSVLSYRHRPTGHPTYRARGAAAPIPMPVPARAARQWADRRRDNVAATATAAITNRPRGRTGTRPRAGGAVGSLAAFTGTSLVLVRQSPCAKRDDVVVERSCSTQSSAAQSRSGRASTPQPSYGESASTSRSPVVRAGEESRDIRGP